LKKIITEIIFIYENNRYKIIFAPVSSSIKSSLCIVEINMTDLDFAGTYETIDISFVNPNKALFSY